MRAILFFVVFFAFSILNSTSYAKMDAYGKYWSVETGKLQDGLKFCNLIGSWVNGPALNIFIADGGLYIAMDNDEWNIPKGTSSVVDINFDGSRRYSLDVLATSEKIVTYNGMNDFPYTMEILKGFALSRSMNITFPNGEVLTASLDGTKRAVIAWQDCAARWLDLPLIVVASDEGGPAVTAPSPPPAREASGADARRDAAQPAKKPAGPTAKESSGTGIAVTADGVIATNAHVVEGCKRIEVRVGENSLDGKLLARDKTNDVALVRVVNTHLDHVARFSDGPAELGGKVAAYGFPLYGMLATGGNFTLGYVTGLTGMGDDSRFIQISTPVQPGNSGGPLVDGRGRLVGMITSKLNAISVAEVTGDIPQNVNFAIRAQVLKSFLEINSIKPTVSSETKDKADPELAATAKDIAFLVRCLQ